jgi:hypothetical protein
MCGEMDVDRIRAATESVTAMTTVETLTVLGWLRNAGITEERARMHVEKGHVYADGVRVSDPDAALAGARIELRIRPDWD